MLEDFQRRRLAWAALALLAAGAAGAGDWPQWGGPNRDFTVAVAGLAERWPDAGPRRLWRRPLGAGHAAVVTRGDLVFAVHRDGDDEVTSALAAASGETVWQRRDPALPRPGHAVEFSRGPNATPAVTGGVLVTLGYAGLLQGLDADTGEPLWRHDLLADFAGELLRFGYAASPLLHHGLVIVLVGGARQGVAAFDPRDGAVVWRSPPLYVSYASPIAVDVGGQEQIVFLSAEEVFGLDAGNGALLWRAPCRNGFANNASDPIWNGDGLLWVASQPGDGARVLRLVRHGDGTTVERLWADREIALHFWNAIRVDDHVYASLGPAGTDFTAVDLRTGGIAWSVERFRKARPIRAGGKLILLDEDGRLVLARVSPEKLEVLAETRLFEGEAWTVPTLAGTTLYARDQREVVALDLAAEGATPGSPGSAPGRP